MANVVTPITLLNPSKATCSFSNGGLKISISRSHSTHPAILILELPNLPILFNGKHCLCRTHYHHHSRTTDPRCTFLKASLFSYPTDPFSLETLSLAPQKPQFRHETLFDGHASRSQCFLHHWSPPLFLYSITYILILF
jgi:hypothetical protein